MKPKVSEWEREWKLLVDNAVEDAFGNPTKMSYDDYLFELVWINYQLSQ